MRYSTIVEKDDKTLLDIIAALEQFEQDRFIAGPSALSSTDGHRPRRTTPTLT